jgi:hypothetical protein
MLESHRRVSSTSSHGSDRAMEFSPSTEQANTAKEVYARCCLYQ